MKSARPIKKPAPQRNVEELPSTYVAKAREPEPSRARPRSRRASDDRRRCLPGRVFYCLVGLGV